MSRGPGRWQRVILDALRQHPDYDVFPLPGLVMEYLQREPKRAELVAARRALKTLAVGNIVRAVYRPRLDEAGRALPGAAELCVVRFDSGLGSVYPRTDAPGLDHVDRRPHSRRTFIPRGNFLPRCATGCATYPRWV